MDFVAVGIEIKVWPWAGVATVDQRWDSSEKWADVIKSKFGLIENEYQLIDVPTNAVLTAVCEFAKTIECINVMLVELPSEWVSSRDETCGFDSSKTSLNGSELQCRGLDVCDPDGLFSALHHPAIARAALFGSHELSLALATAADADRLDRQHAPFVPVRISTLK